MSTATCDLRFSLQNRYAAPSFVGDLEPLGLTNDAVTISGRATLSEKTISKSAFIAAKPSAIRAKLTSFLATNELPRPNSLVILDMEPAGISPRALGAFEGPELRQLVRAYARRIRVTRQVLQAKEIPGLGLGLYQVIVPDGKGQLSKAFAQRLCGYIAAGRLGLYDQLDFICPVLYQRFGPEDATPPTLRAWIDASTQQAIDGSLALARSDGTRVPLVPILGFWVFNGNSENDRRPSRRRASVASWRSCRARRESRPSCSGRARRPRRRWRTHRSRSSRSTSSVS
jgi:hypothetical protein